MLTFLHRIFLLTYIYYFSLRQFGLHIKVKPRIQYEYEIRMLCMYYLSVPVSVVSLASSRSYEPPRRTPPAPATDAAGTLPPKRG